MRALMRGGRSRQNRSVKQRCGEKLGDVGGEARIFDAADQALAHDDMRREIFHDDHRLCAIEMEDFRREARRVARLFDQRVIFEPGALERQRPGFADEPDIGQRLLDDERRRSRPRR